MKCQVFRKKVLDFIHDTLSTGEIMEMKEHMKSCKECTKIYNEEVSMDKEIENFIIPENMQFNSQIPNVMARIDKNYYNKTLKRRAQIFAKRNIKGIISIASIAAAVILFFAFLEPMGLKEYNNIYNGKKQNSASSITELYKKSNQTYIVKLSSNNNILDKELKSLKTMRNSALPWFVDYVSNDKVYIRNYPVLLTLSTGNLTECRDAVDLKKIGAVDLQGNVISNFTYSPDGNYVIINSDGEHLKKQDNKIYLYDFLNRKMTLIDKAKYDYENKWSVNSRYFAYLCGNEITIYDVKTLKKQNIFFKNAPRDFAVSEDGDIAALVTSKNSNEYYLLKRDKKYSINEINVSALLGSIEEKNPKNLLYFNNEVVVYYNNGNIIKYDIKNTQTEVIKNIGINFKCTESNFRYSVFTDGTSTIVTDNAGKFYKYSDVSIPGNRGYMSMSFSPDLKKCLVTNKNESFVLTSDGRKIEPQDIGGFIMDYSMNKNIWINNNTLVRVRSSAKLSNIEIVTVYVPD